MMSKLMLNTFPANLKNLVFLCNLQQNALIIVLFGAGGGYHITIV